MVVYVMTLLTDKATQAINQWAKCPKFVVKYWIYINDRDNYKRLSVLNTTFRPTCMHSKF